MSKCGRPKSHGYKPLLVLRRDTMVIFAYQNARAQGTKHSSAITEAVEYVKKQDPEMTISETEVKRVLRRWQGRGQKTTLFVTVPDSEHKKIVLPGGRVCQILWTAAVGSRAEYPRANARVPLSK